MSNKLYAIRVKVLDGDCELTFKWLRSDYYISGEENFTFTEIDELARVYSSRNRAIKIANEVKSRFSDTYDVSVVEVEEMRIIKLKVVDAIEL